MWQSISFLSPDPLSPISPRPFLFCRLTPFPPDGATHDAYEASESNNEWQIMWQFISFFSPDPVSPDLGHRWLLKRPEDNS